MNERKRVFLLIGIMGAVSLIVGGIVFYMLYQAAFKGQESRLMEVVQSQARMMEAITRNEALSYKENRERLVAAVIEQVKEAHSKYKGLGETGEFTLARKEGDQIVFLLQHRYQELDQPLKPVSFDSSLAEPMRQALLRKSGTIVGQDYRGIIVLAAYEPVAQLNLGLVAKIDLAEIRAPFIKAAAIALSIGIIFIIIGAWLFIKVTNPIVRRLYEHIRQMEIADHSLRQSEDRFKKIIQKNADAIVVTTKDIIRFANPAAETIFGRPVQELMGIDIGFPLIGKESVDMKILHPSGAQVIAAMRAVEIEWEGESSYLISLHDITERKKAEDRIQHLNTVIRAIRNVNQLITKEKDREQLIRGACENMVATRGFNSTWIALMDESGASTHCAESGVGESFLKLKEGLEQGKFPHCLKKALAHSGVSFIEDVFNECVECPLRSYYQDYVSIFTRIEHGGKVYGVLVSSVRKAFALDKEEQGLFQEVGEDIAFALNNFKMEDERKKIEQQLIQAQKMESVGRLAGGVAHDYNNISSIIIGFSELALEKVEPSDPLHNDLVEVLTAAKRSTNITRQLLAFARQQTIAPRVLNLNDNIESMLKMLRRLIGEDIDLAWLPGAEVWPVKIDPSQIDQIMANLCVNARDAIADVGKVTIETKNISFDEDYCADHAGFVPGEYALLAVSDNGSGMAQETIDKVFEPFFTTKGLGKGTGLGMSTVYGIVKQNNGFINVYSEPEKGTTIKVYLSRHTGQAAKAHSENTLEIPLSRGETVLLVEDDASILKLGKRILEGLGYAVLSANSPSEATKLAEEHPNEITLLITDVVMPEMNGRELAEQLRNLYPNLKILFMSGYTANVIAHRGVLEDGVCFISKPFSRKDMAVKIREVLDEPKGFAQG